MQLHNIRMMPTKTHLSFIINREAGDGWILGDMSNELTLNKIRDNNILWKEWSFILMTDDGCSTLQTLSLCLTRY